MAWEQRSPGETKSVYGELEIGIGKRWGAAEPGANSR